MSWGSPEFPQWIGILSMTDHMPTIERGKLSASDLTGDRFVSERRRKPRGLC
jgi:hypothetical protein